MALTLALSVIPMLVPQYARMQNEIAEIAEEYQNFDAVSADDPLAAVNEMYSKMLSAEMKYPVGVAVGILFNYIANLALSVYLGFIADKKYKEHVVNSIKKINSSEFSAGNEEFRRLKIMNEGGTSFGFAVLAVIALTVINSNLSSLLSMLIK